MMINHRHGFEFRGLYCYPAEEANTFFYLPLVPRPEVDLNNNPTLLSIAMQDGGFVQMGTRLDAPVTTLDALRRTLARQLNLDAPSLLHLKMANLTVDNAMLLIGNSAETLEEIAHSPTSGVPPYVALFSHQLTAEQYRILNSVIKGGAGICSVQYTIRLQQNVELTKTVSQVLHLSTDIAAWFVQRNR
jgi:hypothetical protein